MSYIGKSPSQGVRQRYYFTATGGETSLSGADDNSKTLIFSDGEYIDVSLNGVALVAGTDYNTTTANTIGGLAALAASDIVEIVVYDVFSVANTLDPSTIGIRSQEICPFHRPMVCIAGILQACLNPYATLVRIRIV